MPISRMRPLLYGAVCLWSFAGPLFVESLTLGPLPAAWVPHIVLAFLHGAYGVFLGVRSGEKSGTPFMPEFLFAYALILFLFAYIFASNANLDYVQRFIRSGGNLRLAMDTGAERLTAALRYAPFLLLNIGVYVAGWKERGPGSPVLRWALPLVLASSLLTALAFPSFAVLDGLGFLGWVCLVPLFAVLYRSGPGRGVFYGVLYGTVASILINYWLGTFSLVSLQIIILIQLVMYLAFMLVFIPAVKLVRPKYRFIMTACSWTVFEYLRSAGFVGYPWGLLGASQYAFRPIIQIASVTGVWGVSFLVVLVNAAAAETALRPAERPRTSLAAAGVAVAAALLFGTGVLLLNPPRSPDGDEGEIRVALVQQNSDPRKHDYGETFDALRRLTDNALGEKPDLVVWSETAFVPNLRRWSREDPAVYPLAAMVREFLAYQESLKTWLVTGNDDYDIVPGADGREERLNYNAAVLFSDTGRRTDTYHKIKLVPFTEYFPYRETLPWVYETLLAFDVHFWEPGTERTVFRHPKFAFSTPICFEDVFPGLVRGFVLEGAEVIVNLSNDYWSLTEAEAKQHAVHALFRAVENRRPLLRGTASGLTMHADPYGRILETLPYYEEGFLVARLRREDWRRTPFTRWGNWFPRAAAGAALVLILFSVRRLIPQGGIRGLGGRRYFRSR